MRTLSPSVAIAIRTAAVAIAVTAAIGGCANTTSTSKRATAPHTPVPVSTLPIQQVEPSTPPSPAPSPTPTRPRPAPTPPLVPVLTPVAHGHIPVDARIGHVYFTEYRDKSVVLAELGTDGRMYPIEKLSTPPAYSVTLTPSPDGRKIMWVAGNKAFTANLDGSKIHQLPGEANSRCGSPAWSPDSKTLAYGIEQKDESTHLYIVNADGSGRRVLDAVGGCVPVWSSDGSTLAYMESGGMAGKVITIRSNGTGRHLVPIVTWHKHDYVYSISSVYGNEALVIYDQPSDDGEDSCGDGQLQRWLYGNAILNLVTGQITRIPGAPIAPGVGSQLTEAAVVNVMFTRTGSLLVQRVLTAYRDSKHVGSQVVELRTRAGTTLATRTIKTTELGWLPAMSAQTV